MASDRVKVLNTIKLLFKFRACCGYHHLLLVVVVIINPNVLLVTMALLESESVSCSVMSYSLSPHGLYPPGSSHGILQSRILEWVAMPFSRRSSQPRDWTQVSCITGRLFTTHTTWKALRLFLRVDTGVGSHFLLQGIFPTQGSNPGLLHCRQISYHPSHQGSP